MKNKTYLAVEQVLTNDIKARNNDKWLVLKVLKQLGFKIMIDYKELAFMPSFETITRCRRKLQEDGKYLPKPEILAMRNERAKQMRFTNGEYIMNKEEL